MNTADFDTDAGRAAKIAERRSKEIDASFRKAGLAIGAVLGAGLLAGGAAMRKYIQNTIEAEKVQAQLASRIADTGGAAQRTLQQLNEQAEKLQGITVFDDEAIGSVQAMLLTFKELRGVQFDQAVGAVLDLSTAMGTDLNSAALQLGKALNDPVKGLSALSRAGVQFSDDQRAAIKAMVEMGDAAGAQTLILRELDSQMGTAAEAARNTLGGALQGLQNSFDNLLEGDSGSDGVRGTVDAVNNLTDVMNDPAVKRGFNTMATGIASVTAEAIEGISALSRFAAAHADLFGIAEKRSSGAALSTYSDSELQQTIALLGRGKSKAKESGDLETYARLQDEITALIRENTRRMQDAAQKLGGNNRFSPAYEAASLNFNPFGEARAPSGKPAAGGRSAGRKAPSTLPELDSSSDELARMVEETMRAQDQFASLAAMLDGPLATAELEHKRRLEEINELGVKSEAGREEIERLRGLEIARYNEEREAIEARMDPVKQMLEDIEFERSLLQMNNAERMTAIQLRGMENATIEDYQKLLQGNQQLLQDQDAMQAQIDILDAARAAAKGLAMDLKEGVEPVKALKNAFADFADSLYEMAIDSLLDSIFGALKQGMSNSGGGGFWSSLFGSIASSFASGGARAYGGPVEAGRPYIVGEKSPELFVPDTAGRIVPDFGKQAGGGSQRSERVNVVVALNDEMIANAMSSAAGERVIVATVENNRGALA